MTFSIIDFFNKFFAAFRCLHFTTISDLSWILDSLLNLLRNVENDILFRSLVFNAFIVIFVLEFLPRFEYRRLLNRWSVLGRDTGIYKRFLKLGFVIFVRVIHLLWVLSGGIYNSFRFGLTCVSNYK